jgi:hypothetical protein
MRILCVALVQQLGHFAGSALTNLPLMPECLWAFKQGEGHMSRVAISVVSGVAMLLAQMPVGFAQNAVSTPARTAAYSPAEDATPSPAILDAFKAFPKGGDLLSKRIEDIVVTEPKLAPGLAKHVQTTPDLNKEQKLAALRGLAAALNRLGVKAAELPVYKEAAPPPPPAELGVSPLLLLLGLGATAGIVCAALCNSGNEAPAPVSP